MFAHNDKPWDEIVNPIEHFLKNIQAYFFKAFCEGVDEPDSEKTPRELLQKRFFEDICVEIGRSKRLETIAEIDEYFNQLGSEDALTERVLEFTQSGPTSKILNRHQESLKEAISPRIKNMIKQYIVFNHVMTRMQYFIKSLSKYDTLDDCQSLIALLFQDVKEKTEKIVKIKDKAARELLDPFIVLNNFIVSTLTEKKYGTFVINGLLQLDHEETESDTIYKVGHGAWNDLLSVHELTQLVARKIEGDVDASQRIAESAALMRAIYASMNEASREISRGSHLAFVDYLSELDEIGKQLSYKDKHQAVKHFMRDLKRLDQLLHAGGEVEVKKKGCPTFKLPSVCESVKNITTFCADQSEKENNEWQLASVYLQIETKKIIKLIDDARAPFDQCFNTHAEYVKLTQDFAANLEAAKALKKRWDSANYQNLEILRQAAQFLDNVIDLSSKLSEVPGNKIVEYLKRHWPELSGSVATGTVASGALGVFALAFPWLVIPGIFVSAGVGFGVGAIRDKFYPAPDKLAPDKEVLQILKGPDVSVVNKADNDEPLRPNDNNADVHVPSQSNDNNAVLIPVEQGQEIRLIPVTVDPETEEKPAGSGFFARLFSFGRSHPVVDETKKDEIKYEKLEDDDGPAPESNGLN